MNRAECDITVPNLDSSANEHRAGEALRNLPGLDEVRVLSTGVWIAYRPDAISPDTVCEALRRAGFHASIYQDSATGRMGKSSQ